MGVQRPSSARARISPSAMQDHRISHHMLGPCCLCPLMDKSKPDIVEAATYMVSEGDQGGQYVAVCAKDECSYFSKSNTVAVYVLTFLTCHHQVPLKRSPRVRHTSETLSIPSASMVRPLKWTYAMLGKAVTGVLPLIVNWPEPSWSLDINVDTVPRHNPTALCASHKLTLLLQKINAQDRPGISEAEFQTLFTKCECGCYVTCRAFKDHHCLNEVIDLTGDE